MMYENVWKSVIKSVNDWKQVAQINDEKMVPKY